MIIIFKISIVNSNTLKYLFRTLHYIINIYIYVEIYIYHYLIILSKMIIMSTLRQIIKEK